MKITKAQLKQIIKEELNEYEDTSPSLNVELTANDINAILEVASFDFSGYSAFPRTNHHRSVAINKLEKALNSQQKKN